MNAMIRFSGGGTPGNKPEEVPVHRPDVALALALALPGQLTAVEFFFFFFGSYSGRRRVRSAALYGTSVFTAEPAVFLFFILI